MTVTTIPLSKLSNPGDVRPRAVLADSDKDEHLLISIVASKWFPHIDFDYADDGADLLLKLSMLESIDELPSVIILNRHMARYDGLRTLYELQAHPVLWQIPVLVVLDPSPVEAEVDCYRAGARWVQNRATSLQEMIELIDRMESFAASDFSYVGCGSLDISLFNQQYAAEIEESLEATARARRLITEDFALPTAA